MFGGIDPKQMASMMKKMGIKTENIIAEEVIIRGPKTIIIKEPSVTVMDVQGQKTFQIMGRIEEMKEDSGDIKLIMEQSGSSKEEAEQALEESQGDIAEAILKLKKR
jgi:nascent polypeptide-associated complex subunit alpha